MLNQKCEIFLPVDSYIEPLLIRVLSNDKLGISYETIKADSVSSSCGKQKGDRFKLSIPYARQILTWNVFFDSQCPEMGPDFIFNDNFLADMDVDILSNKIPSLAKWNPNNEDALLNVLMELLSCYKEYQIQLLQKQVELEREYSTLMKTEIRLQDVEIILLPFGSKPTEAKFLISLSVDLSQLQNYSCKSENYVAILIVTYCGTNWSRIISHLHLTKPLEDVLGGTNAMQLPNFPRNKFLFDYVTEVKKFITEKINSLAQSLTKRRNFIGGLLSNHYYALIEYDTEDYTYATLLFDVEDFHFVVYIQLPLGFPQERLIVSLQSIYHMKDQCVPYTEQIKNFPYNAQWEPYRMIKKLMKHILCSSKDFKYNSIKTCS
ncbi:BRISC and BRCA1-A complex member 2-like [Colletes gigas]|uniref:BRISC and BRCA1-A complex member 2-like n=1 Tax=Colletes gigas TaxID=935657 RepID=UPI001C9B18D1|nr:BRISC and BRCA1-A complex member 2-like [Colletes gigas]XP_043265445.1 BRISC and BRCA1-A complex member 2-like [Colletes gigas]